MTYASRDLRRSHHLAGIGASTDAFDLFLCANWSVLERLRRLSARADLLGADVLDDEVCRRLWQRIMFRPTRLDCMLEVVAAMDGSHFHEGFAGEVGGLCLW